MALLQPLSAAYKGTFAYKTVKDRMPVILTKAIDYLCRERNKIRDSYGENCQEELKTLIGHLSALRSEMQTNKPLKTIDSQSPDAKLWNDYLEEVTASGGRSPSWFDSAWLYVECYMYRKIHEALELTTTLKSLDPFAHQKQQAFQSSLRSMEVLGAHLLEIFDTPNNDMEKYHQFFVKLVEVSLWGNRNDLSVSSGDVKTNSQDVLEQADSFRNKIIINDMERAWQLVSGKPGGSLGYILDNTGLELFADLCLADFLCEKGYFSEVHFYVKQMPWFVSDVTKPDLLWTLEKLESASSTDLQKLAIKWRSRISPGQWRVLEEPFFTSPFPFCEMKNRDANLHDCLSQHKLLIFKGDLNYRKLGADLQWPHDSTFSEFVQGFCPAPLVVLRTLKAEIVVGLTGAVVERLRKESEEWLTSGDYAVIQFIDSL